jgi:methionyl-tRNA synthetase
MPKAKYYITTAIDYTNDVIHVGQAYEKILATEVWQR